MSTRIRSWVRPASWSRGPAAHRHRSVSHEQSDGAVRARGRRRPRRDPRHHAAHDHLGDTAAIARRTGAPVVCDDAVARLLVEAGVPRDHIRATVWGSSSRSPACDPASRVPSLVGRHPGQRPAGRRHPLAFVLETEPGVRLYHYGDTAIFDMSLIGTLYRPTVALLGCTVPKRLATSTPGRAGSSAARWTRTSAPGSPRCSACGWPSPVTTSSPTRGRPLPAARPRVRHDRLRRAVAPHVGETIELVPAELALS